MYQDSFSTQPSSPMSATWSRLDDKRFERALVLFSDDLPDRWQLIADHVGKSVREVMEHYDDLIHDIDEIDSGRVDLPSYNDECFAPSWESTGLMSNEISFGAKTKQAEAERKKGTPWTEQEHKMFLFGLRTYGKGDWRSISRNVVVTRTPTQVASHAQKYFIRQKSAKKERKRSSIHDITTAEINPVTPSMDQNQNWIPQSATQVPQQSSLQGFSEESHLPDEECLLPDEEISKKYQNYNFPPF